MPPIGCREGISPQKTVLRGHVPSEGEYWAARAGDSPFAEGEKLRPGQPLPRPVPAWFHPAVAEEEEIPFYHRVLFADEDLIVVDKPHFLPTTSNGRIVRNTVQTRLRLEFGEDEIVPIHRLDRLTAGLVVCSRRRATRGAYQQLFAQRRVRKHYRAELSAPLDVDELITLPMRKIPGQRRVTVDAAGTTTRTRIRAHGRMADLWPETGHTHQLRMLLNHLGAPIAGDDTYPTDRGLHLYDFSRPLKLWHTSLSFTDPLQGTQRRFSLPQ